MYTYLHTCVARYGTYKLVQKMPGGEKLTGFTRILHRVKPDEWYWVSTPRHGPMRHFCTIGCLSLYYSPGRQAIHPDALERA